MFDYILHKANGIDKVELNQQIPTFRVVTSLLFEAEWQIEEKISLSIVSSTPLAFGIGDWIEYNGKKYQVFTNYSNSGLITDNRYTYKITFYSPERWYKKANMYNTSEIIDESQTCGFRWERVDNETVSNGDIVSLGNQLCYNLNASQGRRVFKLGDVPEALIGVYKDFTFSDPNCLVCLHEICEAFDTFYNIRTNLVGDTDYIIDFGYEPGYFPVTLKYGKKQGLYSLKLNNADEEVYTIFVVRGSTENLPSTYPKLRLSLNDSYPDSVITCPEKFTRWGKSVKELTYEDVKPERTGEVTGIVPGNINAFVDTTLTFSPVGGTIKFLSGPMIGHTLECVGYNAETHTITLKPYEDSNHFVIPSPDSEAYRINVGDKYNIDGIGLPQSYVTDAENRLLARTQKDVEYHSQPRASYDTRIERELIQEENVFPEIGMFVHIVHENLDIDKFLRVKRITQNILGTKPVYESFEVSDLEYQKADVRMYKKAVQAHLQAKKNRKKTDNAILFLKAFSIEKSTEAQAASQAYAAAQAEAARIAAEAYADGEIGEEEARAIADATAKMNEAKSYALAQAAAAESAAKSYAEAQAAAAQAAAEAVAEAEAESAEISAKAYADGVVSAEEQRAIAEAAAKLTEAKNYAESQAAAAESAASTYAAAQAEAARLAAIASAKTYTDTEVATAKSYADSTAADAQSAAQAYALAKANLAETNAEAYADGIVDAEEAARIADATAKLNEAKTYAETKATAAETAAKAYADTQLGNFATTVTGSLSDLQNQIDGSITTHFFAYVPTTANAPASGWTTTALKNQHLGDLFYDTSTGFCYRYQLVSSVYSWQRITDSDVTKALADAAAAQDTADSKRRVFVATPTTPYDIGDLWLKSGDLYKCKVTRLTGSYVASDWEKGVKYTDDTVANQNLILAQQYADTKKAEAIAAAEAAAEAEALAAQTAAEAHADGIVTAEEQARIADVNAKLVTAQSYAETKASEAQTAAQNYAATAASNAQSAAQSYALAKANLAETTAKAYADGIVTAEETRAIADATAKANAAKAAAEATAAALDDAIQVGGRNLTSGWDYEQELAITSSALRKPLTFPDKVIGQQVTVSFYGKSSNGTNRFYASIAANASTRTRFASNVTLPSVYTRFVYTFAASSSTDVNSLMFVYGTNWHPDNSGSISLKEIKVEVGNKATDWTPAPEDVQAEIDAAAAAAVTTAASDANTKMNAAKDAIAVSEGYANFADKLSKAVLTINGLLNSQIINVDDLFANTAFVAKLVAFSAFVENFVARNFETTPTVDGWFIRMNDDDPTVFEVRKKVNGVVSETEYMKVGYFAGRPTLEFLSSGQKILIDNFGVTISVNGFVKTMIDNGGLFVNDSDSSLYSWAIAMYFDNTLGITRAELRLLPTSYNSERPDAIWKDSLGFLKIGNVSTSYLPDNTIQYFTQTQWDALSTAQKEAIPLALVEET
jgi:hypothetical protein